MYVDPLGGAFDNLATSVTDWVTNVGAPGIVAVMSVGIIVTLLTRYARKAVRSA